MRFFPLIFRLVRRNCLIFGLSTIGGWTFGITLVRPSVCPYVCPSVTPYLGDRSLLFPETWQLGRTWIGDKNVPSGFLN